MATESITMKCPVCPFKSISKNEPTCPNCGTDLTLLSRIRQLWQIHFNKALKHTRMGQHPQAMNWSSSAVCLGGDAVPAKVLLGKILWRKGNLQEAIHQWASGLEDDPENIVLKDLLERANQHIRNSAKRRASIQMAKVIIAASGVLVFIWIAIGMHSSNSNLARELVSSNNLTDTLKKDFERYKAAHRYANPEVESAKSDLADLQLKLVTLVNSANLGQQAIPDTNALLTELGSIDGVLISQRGQKAMLKFSRGLFSDYLDRISPIGRSTLDKIITILDRQKRPIQILVKGHTDNRPITRGTSRWRDNWSLGFIRANTVLIYIRSHLKSRQIELTCCSAGASNPPFPNDDLANRRKNRTVVLHFAPDSFSSK